MKDKKSKNKDKNQNDIEIEYRMKPPKCSFCGRSADKVEKIIQGMNNSAFICDECIRVCYNMIMETSNVPTYTPEEFNEKLKRDIEEENKVNTNKELLPQATVYFDQGRLGLMKGKEILIPAQYHQMSLFKEQLSIVRKDSLWGVINTEGKEVIPLKYSSISKQYYYGEPPFFMVEQHRLWGTMDAKGKQMVPPMYQFLQYEWMYTYPKLLLAQKDNLWGFINLKGEEVLPLKYDYIYKDNYGYTCYGNHHTYI